MAPDGRALPPSRRSTARAVCTSKRGRSGSISSTQCRREATRTLSSWRSKTPALIGRASLESSSTPNTPRRRHAPRDLPPASGCARRTPAVSSASRRPARKERPSPRSDAPRTAGERYSSTSCCGMTIAVTDALLCVDGTSRGISWHEVVGRGLSGVEIGSAFEHAERSASH